MGHITTDRIEDAWKTVNSAERFGECGQTARAVSNCEEALETLYHSADGMGQDMWFATRENKIRYNGEPALVDLKRQLEPDEDDVMSLIETVRELCKDSKEHLEPILQNRLEDDDMYTDNYPTARLD